MVSGEQHSGRWRLVRETVAAEQKFCLELLHCQGNQLFMHLVLSERIVNRALLQCEGLDVQWPFGYSFFFFFFDPHLMFLNRLCLEERKYLLHNTMVSKLICWYFLCNSMVKQLLRVSVWLPHHLDPEVIFKKMWTARSLCSAQVLLLQLKEGRLCSCMFPKTQQFWMGILKYCTVRAPRNRAKFQVSIFVVL